MPTPRSVRFSRTLGIADAIAMAAPIALTVGLFGVAPVLLQQAGHRILLAYPLAVVLLFPIALALIERSSASFDSGSPYRIAASGSAGAHFAVGSLSLLGYLAIATLVLDLVGRNLAEQLHSYLGIEVSPFWWTSLLLLVTALRLLTGGAGWTRTRSVLAWAALLVPVISVLVGFAQRATDLQRAPRAEAAGYWLTGVALLGATLWAIEPLLARRAELSRPGRTVLASSAVVWLGTALVAALATDYVLREPDLELETWALEAARGQPQIELALLVAGVFLAVVALVRAAVAAARLLDRMAADGFLPSWLGAGESDEVSLLGVASFLLLSATTALTGIERLTTLGVAALSFFLTAALVLLPWARLDRAGLPLRRYPRLPLHPLVPSVAIAIALFLTLILPVAPLALGGGWIGLSVLVWFGYARSHALRSEEAGLLVGTEDESDAERAPFRILVGALTRESLPSLLNVALPLARRHQGEVVVVEVVERSARAFPSQLRRHAEAVHDELEHLTEHTHPDERVLAIVRIAPSEHAGIIAAANELDARLVILPWHGNSEEPDEEREELLVERLFRGTPRPIAVLHGELSEPPSRLTVGTGGGPNSPYALELAEAIAPADDRVELLTVVPSAVAPAKGNEILERTVAASKAEEPAELKAISSPGTARGLLEATHGSDLLLLGTAIDRFLGRSFLGGVATDVALARDRATLLVKRGEPRATFVLRWLWQAVAQPLPSLTVGERTEVFRAMRSAARADVDFYVLISLSSALATFGLRQSSTAVVIGAMLVAPLMSPILALAHGLVQGHLQMIRRAAVSTVQGVATSIGVSALIGILWPDIPPTPEMLSRGAPTLLDLAVAVAAGAAAAYGVSRKSVAASLPGVAIAVALVPPLCVTGHGLGESEFALAAGAFLLFLTNLAGIVLVGALVFLLLGFRPSTVTRDERVRRGLLLAALTILLLAIPLGIQGRELRRAQTLEAMLEEQLGLRGDAGRAANLRVQKVNGVLVVSGQLFAYEEIRQQDFAEAQRALSDRIGVPVRLDLAIVPAQRMSLDAPP